MFRTPPSSTSKEELKPLIRQILSSNSGVELIKKQAVKIFPQFSLTIL